MTCLWLLIATPGFEEIDRHSLKLLPGLASGRPVLQKLRAFLCYVAIWMAQILYGRTQLFSAVRQAAEYSDSL